MKSSNDENKKFPQLLVYLLRFTLGTLLLSITLNVIASLFFFSWPWSTSSSVEKGSLVDWILNVPIKWINNNFIIFVLTTIILVLLATIIFLLFQRFRNVQYKNPKRRYLLRILSETEFLTLTGIPAGLVARSVPLDEVFILLQLRPNRPLTDYPLTEEQLEELRERLKLGGLTEEIQRILIDAERNWLRLTPQDRISIVELWNHLTRESPAAVIQGYPGMGKSTLVARLALHMTRRSLNRPDPLMGAILDPLCVPIIIRLGAFATEFERARHSTSFLSFSLQDYIEQMIEQYHVPGLFSWFQVQLEAGLCLVLFDGLDEVSDLQVRKYVQEAITLFIHDYRGLSRSSFNRFLITSRVAGYDQAAFPDYPHYTIAELTIEQMEIFLPRWFRASVGGIRTAIAHYAENQEKQMIYEAEQTASRLKSMVREHRGIRELAENPLLLTLLSVMQQNSIELPRQRADLYAAVTRTLLENRNIAKGLVPISEMLTIERLGPLAYQMQEIGNSFAHQKDVMNALEQIITGEGGTADQISHEASSFLNRLRERGGLFVLRTGDYFGFFHRSFQEYFAARYLLNQMEGDLERWIEELVKKAHQRDDQWREPFLLAMAYKSSENKTVVRQIIQKLLNTTHETNFESYVHDLILASECIIESKPLVFGPSLERQIAAKLLHAYTQALQKCQHSICEQIENVTCRWLIGIPDEAYQPSLLIVLDEILSDSKQKVHQKSALVMLAMISQQLAPCTPLVFNTLIPLLLTLANQKSMGVYTPRDGLLTTSDSQIMNLAISILSLMSINGLKGELLKVTRQLFGEEETGQVPPFVRFSLESRNLLILAPPPQEHKEYANYTQILGKWFTLSKTLKPSDIKQNDVETCIYIYMSLLSACSYIDIITVTFMNKINKINNQHTNALWQAYLSDQLAVSSIATYQDIVFFWMMLFPESTNQKKLITLIGNDLENDETPVQRSAQNFLALLGYHLLSQQDVSSLQESSASRKVNDQQLRQARQDLQAKLDDISEDVKKVTAGLQAKKFSYLPRFLQNYLVSLAQEVQRIQQMLQTQLDQLERHARQNSLNHQDKQAMRMLQNEHTLRILRVPQALWTQQLLLEMQDQNDQASLLAQLDWQSLSNQRHLLDLAEIFLTRSITEKAVFRLSGIAQASSDKSSELVDLLFILVGRVILIRELNVIGEDTEKELRSIAEAIFYKTLMKSDEIDSLLLNIIRSFPMRSANEIELLMGVADAASNLDIRQACINLLRSANLQA